MCAGISILAFRRDGDGASRSISSVLFLNGFRIDEMEIIHSSKRDFIHQERLAMITAYSRPRILAIPACILALTAAAFIPERADAFDTAADQLSFDYFQQSYDCSIAEVLYGTDTTGVAVDANIYSSDAAWCSYYSLSNDPDAQVYYSYYAYQFGWYGYLCAKQVYEQTGDPFAFYTALYNYNGAMNALKAYNSCLPQNPGLGYDPNAPTGSTVDGSNSDVLGQPNNNDNSGSIDTGTSNSGSCDPGSTDPGISDPGSSDPGSSDPGSWDGGSGESGSSDY
jgi:hypothetical protein